MRAGKGSRDAEQAAEQTMALPNTAKSAPRLLAVQHTTRYRYDRLIQHSKHCVHLRPIDDIHQRVERYRLSIAPDVPSVEFEDVFGNWASRFQINRPYTELTVAAESTVALCDVDPFAFAHCPLRPSFPLVWMP